jgi:hypothetical protein
MTIKMCMIMIIRIPYNPESDKTIFLQPGTIHFQVALLKKENVQ